jgi:hypothetical protein
VVVVTLLVIIVVVAVLVGAALVSHHVHRPAPTDVLAQYRAAVGLYAIRKRMEGARFRTEVRQDAACRMRELRQELDEQRRSRP